MPSIVPKTGETVALAPTENMNILAPGAALEDELHASRNVPAAPLFEIVRPSNAMVALARGVQSERVVVASNSV